MLTEHRFATEGVTLNYAQSDTAGPALVLLHGGSARWQSALPLIPELSRRWQVYVPDLRGHGRSAWVPGGYRLSDYAVDITMFLEQVVQRPAVLFGHSLGGQVAIVVAAAAPQLVGGLIIGDAPFDRARLRGAIQRNQSRLRYWRAWAGSDHSMEELTEAVKNTPITVEGEAEPVPARIAFGEEAPWFRDLAEQLRHNDPDMLAAVMEFDQMHEVFDCERLFPLIECPVLIIQGSPAHGGQLTDAEIDHALRLLPHATVARMETVGHPLHTQEREPVLREMEAFLGALEPHG